MAHISETVTDVQAEQQSNGDEVPFDMDGLIENDMTASSNDDAVPTPEICSSESPSPSKPTQVEAEQVDSSLCVELPGPTDARSFTNDQIYSNLDVEVEFERLGGRFGGGRIATTGWRACYSILRHGERKAKAGLKVNGNGRGLYKDHGDGGVHKAIYLHELAALTGHGSWQEYRDELAYSANLLKRVSPNGMNGKPTTPKTNVKPSKPEPAADTPTTTSPEPPPQGPEPSSESPVGHGWTAADLPLIDLDSQDLEKSGIAEKTRIKAAIMTETDAAGLSRLLGWKGSATCLGSGMVIPYFDVDGKFAKHVRIKPAKPRNNDGNIIKYEATLGSSQKAYFPPPGLGPNWKNPQEVLVFTEGEKKVLALLQGGIAAIGLAGVWGWQKKRESDKNGKSKGRRQLIPDLAEINWNGRTIVLLLDSDAHHNKDVQFAGREFVKVLKKKGANVRVVLLPPGQDVNKVGADDYIVGNGIQAMRELLGIPSNGGGGNGVGGSGEPANGSPPNPQGGFQATLLRTTLQEYEECLRKLSLQPLGEYADGNIDVFSKNRGRIYRIPNVSRITRTEFIRICGEAAVRVVGEGDEAAPLDGFELRTCREAVAYYGGQNRLDDDDVYGAGIWMNGSDIVIVNGKDAAILRGDQLVRLESPRIGNRVLSVGGRDWTDFTELETLLRTPPTQGAGPVEQLREIIARWPWRDPVDAEVATGLVVASWIQTLLLYRPLVGLVGESNCGKSLLFNRILKPIFGELAAYFGKPTEAAIRQLVGNKATVVLCDEFESDANRQRVLDMFRLTSEGGQVIRGTSDQRGIKFTVRHIPWFAAIEAGLESQPDRNRFISLNLIDPKGRKWPLPSPEQLGSLSRQLQALALRHAKEAMRLAEAISNIHIDGVDARKVSGYAVPAAMLSAIAGHGVIEAEAMLRRFIGGRAENETQAQPDHVTLLQTIMESTVDVGSGERRSVAQIVLEQTPSEDQARALVRCGITRCQEDSAGRRPQAWDENTLVFFSPKAVRRHLLRGTPAEHQQIDVLLLRIDGAKEGRRRMMKMRLSGVLIPFTTIRRLLQDENPETDETDDNAAGT